MPHTEAAIDSIELPLKLATDRIERIGCILDELKAKRDDRLAPQPAGDTLDLLGLARAMYRHRRKRDEAFEARLFSDPGWDILLDLFIAAEEGKQISVSSACIGSSAPSTTALRHLSALVRHGLICRKSSDSDSRVSWVSLSPMGHEKMTAVLWSWES